MYLSLLSLVVELLAVPLRTDLTQNTSVLVFTVPGLSVAFPQGSPELKILGESQCLKTL